MNAAYHSHLTITYTVVGGPGLMSFITVFVLAAFVGY